MIKKRFQYNWKTGRFKDTQSEFCATSNMRVLETQINDACYSYEKRIKELEEDYEYLEKEYKELARDYSEEEESKIMWHSLYEKSQEECKELKKLAHLIHMESMFSTVKSFNGDINERYVYSNQTDTIYDTANNYGQYDKILNNIEITMLLNEYETLLNGSDLND